MRFPLSTEQVVSKSPFQLLCQSEFPGARWESRILRRAGNLFSRGKVDQAKSVLQHHALTQAPPDLQVPVSATIVASSRDYRELHVVKFAEKVQAHVFGLREVEVAELRSRLTKINEATRDPWLKSIGLYEDYTALEDYVGSKSQVANAIIKSAISVYDGVVTRLNNQNEKRAKRAAADIEAGRDVQPRNQPIAVFDVNGRLAQPPGVNPTVRTTQGWHPVPFVPSANGPLSSYNYDPSSPLRTGRDCDALEPDYNPLIRQQQRSVVARTSLNKYRPSRYVALDPSVRGIRTPEGRRARKAARSLALQTNGAILVVLHHGEDWILIDVRGICRQLQRRGYDLRGLSLNDLMNTDEDRGPVYVTGDPVIHFHRGVVQYMLRAEHVNVVKREPYLRSRSTYALTHAVKTGPVTCVAIDLGQINPVAAGFYAVDQYTRTETPVEGKSRRDVQVQYQPTKPLRLGGCVLPATYLADIERYRTEYDATILRIKKEAEAQLTPEQQAEIQASQRTSAQSARAVIQGLLGSTIVPWESMTTSSTYISEALLTAGVSDDTVRAHLVANGCTHLPASNLIVFPKTTKGKKTTMQKRFDARWATWCRPRLSQATSTALRKVEMELQRKSPDYTRLSRRKLQLVRSAVNLLRRKAQQTDPSRRIVWAIEDLQVLNMHGCGKVAGSGWDSFFQQRRENRWFIPAFHKALAETAQNRGEYVMEVNPAYTSQRCTQCGHIDRANRDGDAFKCVSCSYTANTDLDVATENIFLVALTGKAIKKVTN